MKKRLLVLVLVLTMVLGLASCGSKGSDGGEATLSSQMEKMSKMEAGYAEIIMDIDTDLLKQENLDITKMSFKITAQADKDDKEKGKAEISYKIDQDTDFTKLTTAIVDNDVVYINVAELKTAATDLLTKLNLTEYSTYLSVLPDTEYLKIDSSSLSQLTSEVGDSSDASVSYSEKDIQQIAKISEEISKVIEDAVKGVDPAVLSADGDKVAITLSDKNAKATIEALAKADYSKCFDNVIALMEDTDVLKSYATTYKDKKDDVLNEIKTELDKAATSIKTDEQFSVNYSIDVSDTKVDQILTANVTSDEGYMKLSVECNLDGDKKESIEVPDDAMDFMTLMTQLLGGMDVE